MTSPNYSDWWCSVAFQKWQCLGVHRPPIRDPDQQPLQPGRLTATVKAGDTTAVPPPPPPLGPLPPDNTLEGVRFRRPWSCAPPSDASDATGEPKSSLSSLAAKACSCLPRGEGAPTKGKRKTCGWHARIGHVSARLVPFAATLLAIAAPLVWHCQYEML